MNRIINPQQIKNSTVQINYKGEQGTGFFIAESLIITAYHVVLDDVVDENSLKVSLNDDSIIKCKILSIDLENDICLLSCEFKSQLFLPLAQSPIRINENWESYGFPYQGEKEGLRIYGTINELVDNEKYDFLLNCSDIESDYDYGGLSGSPIVSMGKVIGVVLKQLDDKIGGISIRKMINFLYKEHISVQYESFINEIPKQLEEDIKSIVSNYDVHNKLDESIKESGSWILLEGNPGTGKTLNVASYSSDVDTVVLGKYFVKIPNDDKPKSLRISKEFFLTWLEETISLTMTGDIAAKSVESFSKRIELLSYSLIELESYLKNLNKNGVFFIDGVDEISNVEDFLGIIPVSLPENIKIVLSCISKQVLPSNIKSEIKESQSILVTPLDINQCEFYINQKLNDVIDYDNIQKIAFKSEGHPLYLNYLIDFVKNSEIALDKEELNEWIDSIPVISGDIVNYYNTIWDNIFDDQNKLWICLILSQLRQAIDKNDFFEILTPEIRSNFYSVFPKISYLIKGEEVLEIYHNSFKEFILSKIPLLKKDSNDLIVAFCEKKPDNKYSITNSLFHYSLSNSPKKAIINCNQEWADKMAINHIEPDLIVSDIKNIIELSIDLEKTTEVIRLLLLLQRIDFRYNSVFVEYAHQIALVLIANGNFEDALKYIVRRNVLLVNNDDALLFLQLFYENEAFVEAEILLKAIEVRYRRVLNEQVKSKNGINPNLFIYKSQTLALSMYEGSEKNKINLIKYLNHLKRLKNGSPEMDSLIDEVIKACSSWNIAYFLRIYNDYNSIKDIPEKSRLQLDNGWVSMLTNASFLYSEILNTYNTNYFGENDKLILLTKDIEYLIENYGFENDSRSLTSLIKSLIRETSRPDLLKLACEEYLKFEINFGIRNINGVDFEYLNYENLCLKNNCLGFLDDSDDFDVSSKYWEIASWEDDLSRLIDEVHFFEGKLYYYKSSNQLEDNSDVIKTKFEKILKTLNYSFSDRAYWERSYQFPEQVFPLIYSKLINLIHEFDNTRLELFLELLREKSKNQMSLYSEGYRKALHEIIKSLILIQYNKDQILQFVELWEIHVLNGIQNRWERTEELLKINEVYGILRFEDKSRIAFQEMLNTSMGPSWYKESQLGLINTTLKILKSKPSDKIIQNYASLLDYASGEMTFQRYVKYDKENFISSMIVNDRLNEALEYYKFEVLPNPKVLIRNAEISDFDAPRIGDGYCLGARNIIEQNGILMILKDIKISPYLKWALCEIFTINDDIFRYITDFGKKIAKTLNDIEKLDDGHIDSICESISVLVASSYIENEDRRSLLSRIGSYLTISNTKRLQKFLLENEIKWGIGEDIENQESIKDKKQKNNFDLFNDKVEQKLSETNVVLLHEVLEIFEKERMSIWFNNWSHSTDKAKDNIKLLLESDRLVLKNLKENVLKFDDEYWVICKELIWFLEGKLDDLQISEIYEIVNEHFHHIVRPSEEVKEKYSWINSSSSSDKQTDELVISFIIWHLNHPNKYIREKTFEILESLPSYLPLVIKVLFKECISNIPELSTELSSLILNKISNIYPELIKDCLVENPELINDVSKISHITIVKNMLEVSGKLNQIGYESLYKAIKGILPETINLSGDVFFEEDHFELIQFEIDELNEESLLDEQFCIKLNELINEYCYPLNKDEIGKSDRYLVRSFYRDDEAVERYNYFLRHALNCAIFHRATETNIDLIHSIINEYNDYYV